MVISKCMLNSKYVTGGVFTGIDVPKVDLYAKTYLPLKIFTSNEAVSRKKIVFAERAITYYYGVCLKVARITLIIE